MGRPLPTLSPEVIRALEAYGWPGNVRELRNVVDRATVMGGATIALSTLEIACPEILVAAPIVSVAAFDPSTTAELAQPIGPSSATIPPVASDLKQAVQVAEKQRVLEALAKSNGNQARAAELLGVSRRTLINKIEAYGIGRPRKG